MDKFTATYKVDDGYVGKSRSQHFELDEGDIDPDMDESELRSLFNDAMEEDFKVNINYYSSDEDRFVEWAKEVQEEQREEDE